MLLLEGRERTTPSAEQEVCFDGACFPTPVCLTSQTWVRPEAQAPSAPG